MNNDRGSIPVFAIVVSALMILIGLFFAYMLFFNSAAVMTQVDTTSPAIHRMIFMLATRSLTMALALLLALVFRSRLGLIAVLVMRVLTEVLDTVIALAAGEQNMLVIGGVMVLLELIAIGLLWRSVRTAP